MATLKSLLASGYFPRELPPPFTTTSYARHAAKVGRTWPAKSWTRCVAHNLARPGGLRRPLKIPHPVSYFALADVIAENWPILHMHTWAHRLSASRPFLLKSSGRAVVSRYQFGELTRLRALRRRAARYLLVTDIDQFYPTIYTHAIPWALHTKAVAKTSLKTGYRKTTAPLVGDLLDKALQRMNDGQTHGIPIGPDTSLVIAEVLLAAADATLISKHDNKLRGFRYVDDYELSFETLRSAEEALADLQAILAGYELFLNPRKTRIVDLPQGLDSAWSIDLKSLSIRSAAKPVGQRNDLLAFFGKAFDLAAANHADSVLRYAVASVQGISVNASAWRAFHNCVLSAAAADASTLPVALGTLYEVARRGGHSVPVGPLAEVIESVIAFHAPRAQSSEVAWALWGALAWKVSLSARSAQLIDAMEDDIVALLALNAAADGLFAPGELTANTWSTLVSQPDALTGEHWLLAYEANFHGWLKTPAVAQDPTFSAMSDAKVSFYDPEQVKPQFPKAGRAVPGGSLWSDYA